MPQKHVFEQSVSPSGFDPLDGLAQNKGGEEPPPAAAARGRASEALGRLKREPPAFPPRFRQACFPAGTK